LARLRRQAHAAYVIAKKDAVIYYLKPPVSSFGIIFPLFFYLAFAAGRSVPPATMVPGIVAMALFFTASAIGPPDHVRSHAEKAKAPRTMPRSKLTGLTIWVPARRRPSISGTNESSVPNAIPAHRSPIRIAQSDAGEVTRRS
jgi:hypothetical protein